MPWINTAPRNIPIGALRGRRAAVNRALCPSQYARRGARVVLFLEFAPDPAFLRATFEARLRLIGHVGELPPPKTPPDNSISI